MKTFRHKKTGEIVTYKDGVLKSSGFCVEIGVEPSSQYWQEIIENKYEILSYYFKNISGKGDYYVDPTYIWYETHKGNGRWSRQGHVTKPYTTEEISNHNGYGIHSVKRLSDGEIFTIGDELIEGTILRFSLSDYNDGIYADAERFIDNGMYTYVGLPLDKWVKSEKPLFTTEDGVDIYEMDHIYSVEYKPFLIPTIMKLTASKKTKELFERRLFFSSHKAAEEYILVNKSCLSIKEIAPIIGICNNTTYIDLDLLTKKLKELVKSKINK